MAGPKIKNPPEGRLLLHNFTKNGKRPTSHRSTAYPCYVPILGESAGAGRVGLAGANIQSFYIFASPLFPLK